MINKLFKLLSGIELEREVMRTKVLRQMPPFKQWILTNFFTTYSHTLEQGQPVLGKYFRGTLYLLGNSLDWGID